MLIQYLKDLRLTHLSDQVEIWLQEAAKHQWPYDEFLIKLSQEELAYKQERRCDLSIAYSVESEC